MTSTSADASTILLDRTNALLDSFTSHPFTSTKLTSSIPIKSTSASAYGGGGGGGGHTENLTRNTTGGYDQTGLSEEGLVMDQDDRNRAKEDLKDFKDRISTLKFAYLEQNARTEFLNHVFTELDENEQVLPIPKEANQEITKRRNEIKTSLRAKKQQCQELEEAIRKEAESLEEPMRKRKAEAEHAARLVQECEAMETEIAMLKNKRSPTERMTLDQALSTVDSQLSQITEYGQRTIEAEKEMKEHLRPRIKQAKLGNERLSNTVGGLEREKREREEKGGGGIDERAEGGCEWVDNATKLYKSLLQIDESFALGGSPPTSLLISFDILKGAGKKSLSIQLGPGGRMTGAKLIDSSENIQDLVDACLPSQDLRGLIQEVRVRVL